MKRNAFQREAQPGNLVMRFTNSHNIPARLLGLALAFLGSTGTASADSYDRATSELTIPSVVIGGATYLNVLATIAGLVSGPTGAYSNGDEDSYDTASRQLTIPWVSVGATAYINVVATVGDFISVGHVSGADTYSANLFIPYVQVGDEIYNNVTISVGSVVKVMGGIPINPRDVYDPVTRQLLIAAVQVGSNTYTNVVIIPGATMSVGGLSPQVTLAPGIVNFSCSIFDNNGGGCTPQEVLLINSGTANLSLSRISVTGSEYIFWETDNCHASVGPGQSCAISVHFDDSDTNVQYSGTLNVADNTSASPHTVPLSGLRYPP